MVGYDADMGTPLMPSVGPFVEAGTSRQGREIQNRE